MFHSVQRPKNLAYRPLLICALGLLGFISYTHASDQTSDDVTVVTVNGKAITQEVVSFLEKSRSHGPLSQMEADREQLISDLLTTELLYQAALASKTHEQSEHRIELELAEKTLLSQLYVMDYLSHLRIDEATLRAEYEAISAPVMVQMERWDFESEFEALSFLESVESTDFSPESSGEVLPWQALESFSFGNMTQARDLSAGDWLNSPIASESGWHVWRCVERSEMTKPSFEVAREGLRQELGQQRLQAHISELRERAEIEMTPGS